MKAFLLSAGLATAALITPVSITPAIAKQRTVIEQLPPEIVDNNYVDQASVTVADTAVKKMEALETKAQEKRAEAGLAPYAAGGDRPSVDEYATLPFTAMMPLVMQDVTRKWGLTSERGGKPVSLQITIENIKTANAAMAMLLSSADELSGEVAVLDPTTQQPIGSFYVQVINNHGGLAGLAMRGAGVREKLVEEFALESARILTGSTKKDWKKRLKAAEKAETAEAASGQTSGSTGSGW